MALKKYRILCFGDSNTWGYIPSTRERYSDDIRWTGILQQKLGSQYLVIEEGLNGRTTMFDYKDRPGKNGLSYLKPCLDSHSPVDVIILFLGTNDTKVEFNLSADQIAQGMETLIRTAKGEGLERPSPNARIIVVGPPPVHEKYLNGYADLIGAESKIQKLPQLYEKLAEKYEVEFLDLSEIAPSQTDGCHLEPEDHFLIADLFVEKLSVSFQA